MTRLCGSVGVLASVALVLVGVLVPAAGASPGKGEIGGPPTFRVPTLPPGEGTQTTPALVIGEGAILDRPAEIVAHGYEPPGDSGSPYRRQVCVWTVYSREDMDFGTCGSVFEPVLSNRLIQIDSFSQVVSPKPLRDTRLSGRLSPEVASVEIAFRRRPAGPLFRLRAIVAQVSGDLQQRLKQPAPFGYFAARIRGWVRLKTIRARAFDASGRPVGSARGLTAQRAY